MRGFTRYTSNATGAGPEPKGLRVSPLGMGARNGCRCWGIITDEIVGATMDETTIKRYLFASDFDQTLSFNDSGYVLSEVAGISTEEFRRKAAGMAKLNLVQQGAELAYLLLHDPEFRSRIRREHLIEAGKRVPLRHNLDVLLRILNGGIEGIEFEFRVLSAAPVEIVRSALAGVVPEEHVCGTEFRYNSDGYIEEILRATAGYGKVAALDMLQNELQIGPDYIFYTGDGSSDMHAMLHVNTLGGFTVAVSESRNVAQIANRTVLSADALAMLVPVLEDIVRWDRLRIREFLESYGLLVQEWATARTDWVTLRAAKILDDV